MNNQRTTPSPRRVVVLAYDALDSNSSQGPESATSCVPVASAYEACAELLIAPTAVLAVDLRLLRPGHLALVRIARAMGTELWGMGPLPAWASSDQLAGMRLVSRDELARALGTMAPPQPGARAGTYEAQVASPQPPAMGPAERLLTPEELNALMGDAT